MTRPIDVVRKIAPHAKPGYLAAIEQGSALFLAQGITTPLRLAHFLAQTLHETGGLTIEWESGAYSAERLLQIFGAGHHSAKVTPDEARQLAHNGPAIFERVYGLGNPAKARELGNTESGDGYRYRGGGILQTTGRGNYREMGRKCGVDFETNPDLVISAEHALKPALAEWSAGNLNAAADANDIHAITVKINGGTNGLAEREQWFRQVRPLIDRVELAPGAVRPGPAVVPPAGPTPPPAPEPPIALPQAPEVPIAPPTPPKIPDSAKHGSVGAVIAGGVGATASAAHAGVSWAVLGAIMAGTLVLAVFAWVIVHAIQNQGK